jgi:hypothetical protein
LNNLHELAVKYKGDNMKKILKKIYDLLINQSSEKKLIPIPVRANNGR